MESCHTIAEPKLTVGTRIALVGNPNVGKSMLFHRLTGKFVMVSNYPGTTVDLSQGLLKTAGQPDLTVIDTPGIVAFPPRSEDEAVTARVLLQETLSAVIAVGDAKNIRRTLHLAAQVAEMGLPMVLVLNMIDEARSRGLTVNTGVISSTLGIPAVTTVATRGTGIDEVIRTVAQAKRSSLELYYGPEIENTLVSIQQHLPEANIAPRALGLFFLCRDATTTELLRETMSQVDFKAAAEARDRLEAQLGESAANAVQRAREAYVDALAEKALLELNPGRQSLGVRLGRLAIHPVWGLPILAAVLYGVYWFVGVFGSTTLVGLLEGQIFGEIINPWVTQAVERLIPISFFSQLLVGEYGLWTMGMTYAVALLLPIVVTFFITFGILEDSGYLPRLAVLTNRIFTAMGLNGQAVLPMVLGLGCVTMATMTTRILNSRRDRILVTLLLALAVPCSAQLGVVMGLLAGVSLGAAMIWGAVTLLVLFLVGWLAAKLMPGERAPLVVELPPLRLPVMSNVLMKTVARLEWYIKEAVPLFLGGTLLLFFLDYFGILPVLVKAGEPLITGWLGLPPEATGAFLLGLLRRDFAATGLFALQGKGLLSPIQIVVSIVTITLFIPCIASLMMIVKERGAKMATGMAAFIFPFAMLVGGVLYRILLLVGWNG